VVTYPDGGTRAFSSVAGNEHLKSGLVSVDRPAPDAFIVFGPDRVSRIPFSQIATITFLTATAAYDSSGYSSQYAQVEVSAKDGRKETFLIYDDQVALHLRWADSIAVSAYDGSGLKGAVVSIGT
jgi:hypothetical protein